LNRQAERGRSIKPGIWDISGGGIWEILNNFGIIQKKITIRLEKEDGQRKHETSNIIGNYILL
jgi:hypothetical protein